MLDLRELKTFRVVAAEKNFTRAASLLHYAQSSVTAQIHGLEEELGVPLFDRMGRRVELTVAGRQLLSYADRLLDMADEAKRAVQNEGQTAGTLTLRAPETLLASAGIGLPAWGGAGLASSSNPRAGCMVTRTATRSPACIS